MELKEQAKQAIKNGSIKLRVKRSGMWQQITFYAREAKTGNISFVELFTNRIIDTTELLRVSQEIGLPIEAPNGKAFPQGTSAQDFSALTTLLPPSTA